MGPSPATQARALTGNRTSNTGLQAGTQSTEPHQPGLAAQVYNGQMTSTSFTKHIQMVKVHMKKYSMSLLMREIQTIITLRCHFLRGDGKKKDLHQTIQRCGATETLRCCAGCEMAPPLWTTVCISLPHKLSHFTPRCLPKRHANRHPQHHLYKNTPHRTFTHNSQSCKRTQTSFKRRILSILPQHSCHVFIKWNTTQQRKGTTD